MQLISLSLLLLGSPFPFHSFKWYAFELVLKCVLLWKDNDWSSICIITVDCEAVHWKLYAADVFSVPSSFGFGSWSFSLLFSCDYIENRPSNKTPHSNHRAQLFNYVYASLSFTDAMQMSNTPDPWPLTEFACIHNMPLMHQPFAIECVCQAMQITEISFPTKFVCIHIHNSTHKHCSMTIQTLVAAKWIV